ncbi:queuosine-tRNA galactosyltransferase-like [Onthophagus taurus]|uniref:queuosine-tRNA galactosyltransferase-like n=1 Tax=Onthophagus taurus TaxID=166361 RepID=UPI0039BDA749
MDISIIIPIYNGEKFIDSCFNSILYQEIANLNVEICVCNDGSIDNTPNLLSNWENILKSHNFTFKLINHPFGQPLGCGKSKNSAVSISTGKYLCFQDVDDLMFPHRLIEQYNAASELTNNYIVGSRIVREPKNSTVRYTNWANNLDDNKLDVQIFTSNGPTIIMPTWFMHRSIFHKIGGFSEKVKGEPEDLIFFYNHLDLGGKLHRVNQVLVSYTYHTNCTTHSIHEDIIWDVRIKRLQEKILIDWKEFTIWNAGKQGRKLFKSLSEENQKKVIALCDVDSNKVGKYYTPFDLNLRISKKPIEIIHFSKAKAPIIICVKMDMTNGVFEDNLNSLNLQEGKDYIIFS